jgi:hypothetical protein
MKIQIDKKLEVIDFISPQWLGDYWLPLDMFKIKNDGTCEGLSHISVKNWCSNWVLIRVAELLTEHYGVDYSEIAQTTILNRDRKIDYIKSLLQ